MAHFFTADTHLGHANIIKYCQRPYLSDEEVRALRLGNKFTPSNETVQKHDDDIINSINARVNKTDTLWILGDFCWGGYDKMYRYRERINCEDVRLVVGNHDAEAVFNVFPKVYQVREIEIEGRFVVMCHYPMRSWNRSHHGSWHLFGHVHGNLEDIPHHLALDVGVDTHDYQPWSWDEIKAYMESRIPIWKAERATWKEKELGGMKAGTHG